MKKKEVKRKLFSVLLTLCMTVGLIGCGQKQTGTEKTAGDPEPAAQQAQESPETSAQPEEGKAETGERPTLRIMAAENPPGYDLPTRINENDTVLWLEDQLGIDLEFELVPADVMAERITLAITSNDLPDIFYFFNGSVNKITASDRVKYGKAGLLLPIEDMLEESFPNLYAYVTEEEPDMLPKLYEADGHIYGVPYIQTLAHMSHPTKLWTNRMFLDALEMDMPETLDEYEAYLKGVIENDVNGNGDPNDEIGLMGIANDTTWYKFFMNAFVPTVNRTFAADLYIDNETDQVLCAQVQDGYREGLRWIHSLWEQGLVYEGSLTLTMDQAKTVYMSEDPAIGSLGFYAPFLLDQTCTAPTYALLEGQVPLSNDGQPAINMLVGDEPQVGRACGVITSACKDVEAAARFLDFHYTREGNNILTAGPDYEEEYVAAEPGELNAVGKQAYWRDFKVTQDDLWTSNHALPNFQIRFQPEDLYFAGVRDESAPATVLQDVTEILKKYESQEYSSISPSVSVSEENLTAVGDIQTQITSYNTQWETDFIVGNKSLDDDWDEYTDGLYGLGLQTVIDAYQEGYEVFLSNAG